MVIEPATSPRQLRRAALGLIIFVGFIWMIRSPLHRLPLERDEGAYAVIARDWLAGFVPYRDRFDHKPPFVYMAYAPAILLGGDPVLAIRRWASVWLLATSLAAWWSARQLWHSEWAGWLAALLVGTWSSGIMVQGITFNSEAVMILPATLALGATLRARATNRALWWMLAGALIGLAILSKPVAVLLVPALIIAAISGAAWRERTLRLVAVAGGFGLIMLSLMGYFGLTGAWKVTVAALWDYNLRYAAQSSRNESGLVATLWPVWKPLVPLLLAAIAGGLSGMGGRWRAEYLVVLLWSGGLIGGAVASLRPYPHYYVAAIPALAVWVTGLAMVHLGKSRYAGPALTIVVVAALCIPPLRSLAPYRNESPAAQTERLYGRDGRELFALAPKVVAWVDRNVSPTATIWVWASEPEIYLLGRRAVPTRFPYDYPLAVLPGAREAALADLQRTPPQVIITYDEVRPEGFAGLQRSVGYTLRVHLGGYDIWSKP